MSKPSVPKPVRLRAFRERLDAAKAASSGAEAKQLIDTTLNAVEDELTDIPYDPERWRTDGRMYPAQDDSASDIEHHPDVTCYRSRRHETLIRGNGAFEIRDAVTGDVLISKPGVDGQGVWS